MQHNLVNLPPFCGHILARCFGDGDLMKSIRGYFSTALSAQLRRKNINQKEFAAAIGVAEGSVSRWLNAKELPSAKRIDKIAEYLGVSPAALFFSSDSLRDWKIASDEEITAIQQGWDAHRRKLMLMQQIVDKTTKEALEFLADESGFKLTPKDS